MLAGLMSRCTTPRSWANSRPRAISISQSDLLGDRQRVAPPDLVVEILAREELLDEVGSLAVEAELEDGDDVAMLEVAGDLGFAQEAVARLAVLGASRS